MMALFVSLLMFPVDAPVVSFQKVVHKHGGVFLQFQVENLNKQAVHFVGYTPESFTDGIPAGEIRPMYLVEARQANAAWKAIELGHCATGRGELMIEAQGKVTFDTIIPEGDWAECRVGFAWSSDLKAKGTVAWTSAIKRDAVKLK